MEGIGGQTEGPRRARGTTRHLAADHLAAGNAWIRCHAQPGAEVFTGFEADELWSHFSHEGGGDSDVDAGDGCQVDSTYPIQVGADIEGWLIGALASGLVLLAIGNPRGSRRRRVDHGVQLREGRLDVPVAGGNLILEMTKRLMRLLQAEQILGAVVARERLDEVASVALTR